MFVKIENYKNPDVCELIDINDIRSAKKVLCNQGVDTNVRDDN
jgi:hypothetical protein